MVFTAAGITRNLHDYGVKRTEYEASCKSAIDELVQIRAQATINYDREACLIDLLEDVENGKDLTTTKATLDVGSKTVKLCAGPVAGIASNIITSTMKKQGGDFVSDLTESAIEEGLNQVQKEAAKEFVNSASEWAFEFATDLFGVAAVALAPVAVGLAGVAAVTACAVSSTARETCTDYISATIKGTGALFSEAFSSGKNREIVGSYRIWNRKWTKNNERQAVLDQKNTELNKLNDDLNLLTANLSATKHQIKERRKAFFNRFVRFFRGSDLLTRMFSAMSKRFENEKHLQENLKAEKKSGRLAIKTQNELITALNDEVNQLGQKVLDKKLIVDNLEKEYSNHLE